MNLTSAGAFLMLAMPSLATALAILAGVATPVLAVIAVLSVVHGGRRVLLLVPLGLGVVVLTGSGAVAELAAGLLTALGCLTLGTAIVRLTPTRWLRLGVLAMAAVDVALLAVGIGQPAATLLAHALDGTGPSLHRLRVGPMSTDYPDLVLAAALGAVVAGRTIQPRAAVLVAILAGAYGGLFAISHILPATVPLLLALLLVEWRPRWPRWTRRRAPIALPQEG